MSSGLIAPGHMFSQHSLNTFAACPRRFLLKYIDHQPWPAVGEDDPLVYEQHLTRGRIFHQWLARDLIGVDASAIVAGTTDVDLQAWWQAYQSFELDALPQTLREVELPVVARLGGYGLYARFDLLALDPGEEAVIVDWKTLERRPSARTLQSRMQTRVYLYAAVATGAVLTAGPPILPGQLSMLYWFTNFPEEPEQVHYSTGQYQRDRDFLLALCERIASMPREAFVMTDDLRLCAYCNYRTLCHARDLAVAGDREAWLEEDLEQALDIDLASVPEIDW